MHLGLIALLCIHIELGREYVLPVTQMVSMMLILRDLDCLINQESTIEGPPPPHHAAVVRERARAPDVLAEAGIGDVYPLLEASPGIHGAQDDRAPIMNVEEGEAIPYLDLDLCHIILDILIVHR